MFKLIRNIGCLSIIIFIVFFVIALFWGGEKIRQVGDKTTEVAKKVFHYTADKADDIYQFIKKKIDEFEKLFRDEKRDTNNKKS